MGVYDRQREELVPFEGPPKQGVMSEQDLTTGAAKVLVRYRDIVMTVDVYTPPGAPITVNLLCPKCRNSLRITADRKRIAFDPQAQLDDGGRLDIEAFKCTWENGEGAGRRISFGLGLCGWNAAIDKNIARDV